MHAARGTRQRGWACERDDARTTGVCARIARGAWRKTTPRRTGDDDDVDDDDDGGVDDDARDGARRARGGDERVIRNVPWVKIKPTSRTQGVLERRHRTRGVRARARALDGGAQTDAVLEERRGRDGGGVYFVHNDRRRRGWEIECARVIRENARGERAVTPASA